MRPTTSSPTLRLPALRPDQAAIVQSLATHRYVVVACGRRWGKTLMAGTLALHRACRGGNVAWVVPTYKNARAPWRFAEAHVAGIGRVHRADRIVELGDGRMSLYSADNDTALRSEAFDLVVVDEAARVREETYTDVLLPTLADRDGRILLISTPRGRNWFWREWQRGAFGSDRDYRAYRAPTIANPKPTIQAAAQRARNMVSDRTYRQEWLAEFVEDGGGVFRGVAGLVGHTPIVVDDDDHDDDCGPAHVYGIDWGRDEDYTVVVVIDAKRRVVVAADRWTGVRYETQLQRIEAMVERLPPTIIYAEKNAMGGPLVEELFYGRGLPVQPFVTTAPSKARLIDQLALAFERRAIGLPDAPWLVAELEAFEAHRNASGMPSYRAPDGMHDDGVMALALAWQGVAWYYGGQL